MFSNTLWEKADNKISDVIDLFICECVLMNQIFFIDSFSSVSDFEGIVNRNNNWKLIQFNFKVIYQLYTIIVFCIFALRTFLTF